MEWDEDNKFYYPIVAPTSRSDPEFFTLTGNAVSQLVHMGHWIPPEEEVVKDKSKHDVFQKVLVMLQISWFALQCMARLVYRLPLTLLELHTMVHVVSAAIMYCFWFKVSLYM